MQVLNLKIKNNKRVLALGAELDTALAYYHQGKVVISDNLGNSGDDFVLLEKKINNFCGDNAELRLRLPDYILTDSHPEYNSTKIGAKLAKQRQIPHIKIQHHHAHIFSAITEYYLLNDSISDIPTNIIAIACDGTGYGLDETIWGGEIFKVKSSKHTTSGVEGLKIKNIERIGYLETQTILGGQLAVEEPARMLMAILAKFLDEQQLYAIMNKFYNQKVLKLLYSQLRQNFNCQTTTSCARVLDAASALLFGRNERKFKHQAALALEEAALGIEPYDDINPVIVKHKIRDIKHTIISNKMPNTNSHPLFTIHYSLSTTPLFQYLTGNLNRDKNRLAATVHQYIADGLWQIAQKIIKDYSLFAIRYSLIFSGGMANNKIFRRFFEDKNVLINKKIPGGDSGIGLGQIGYFLLMYQ